MFDDYEFKNTSTRIKLRFIQQRDEPMYPWEIAGFLTKLNTVYYKFELLNSICSALNSGISATDIFIFDSSLPLYQRYATMNLLSEKQAAKQFYSIGLPFPLEPNENNYNYNLLYQAFSTVNSFLHSRHVRPLTTDAIAAAYETLQNFGLDEAEKHIVDLALERSKTSVEHAKSRHEDKKPITEEEIWGILGKYKSKKANLLSDLLHISTLSDEDQAEIITENSRDSRRISSILQAFFRYFEKTSRPLVCARVSDGKFRVLGRSLINKREQTGLELKEAVRNSPLSTLIEGGIAICQFLEQGFRNNELHKLDVRKKELEIEHQEEIIKGERLKNISLGLDIQQKLNVAAQNSDIQSFNEMSNSFLKNQIAKAYGIEQKNAYNVVNHQGLDLDTKSITVIDTKA